MTNGKPNNTEEFLKIFRDIERELRSVAEQANIPDSDDMQLYQLVDVSHDLNHVQKNRLQQLRRIRNMLIHNPYTALGNNPITISDDVVSHARDILDYLERVPTVLQNSSNRNPHVYAMDDPISKFFEVVNEPTDVQQILVRNNLGNLALITTNMLAVWMSNNFDKANNFDNDGNARHSLVLGDLLPYKEDADRIIVASYNTSVAHALNLMMKAGSGHHISLPAAVVITQNGKLSEAPLALCSRQQLYRTAVNLDLLGDGAA